MTLSLDAWIAELAAALDVDPETVDQDLLLDLSHAVHGVARAAAPLTMFLVGLAAGQRGGGADAVIRVAATAKHLAVEHRFAE